MADKGYITNVGDVITALKDFSYAATYTNNLFDSFKFTQNSDIDGLFA